MENIGKNKCGCELSNQTLTNAFVRSQEEVIKAFEPTEETVNVVKKWLTTVIPEDRITHTDNKAWLAFDASA